MPVFNDEATVYAAVESCLTQTMTAIEIVCVDDGSTDRSVELITQLMARDPRVRLIRHPQNLTALQARRAGVLAATGEYVLFLDGDDELVAEAAEKSLAAAQLHEADLVGFGVEVITQEGNVVGGYQKRLAPRHSKLTGRAILDGLFPTGEPAQGQLWRFLFRMQVLRDAYRLIPDDLALPRVNDLPLLYLVAVRATRYASIPDRLYRYFYGRGKSGHSVDTLEQAEFYADAIRSVESIAPSVQLLARQDPDPGPLLDNYASVRLSIIGYVCSYLLEHVEQNLTAAALHHLQTRVSMTDLIVAAAWFYPSTLTTLKAISTPIPLASKPPRCVMLTTRALTTGGVSNVLLTQARVLTDAGYRVVIAVRRYGSDPSLVPPGVIFTQMVGTGLPERLAEWSELCRLHEVDVIIDHQVLYSRDWPEYALIARGMGVPTIGWLHNFAGRPLYDLNGLHELIKANAPLLATLVTLSPLDVAFWKLRDVPHAVFVPNPPSPLLLESPGHREPQPMQDGKLNLVWWGRLDERTKQISQLIEVASCLRKLSVDFSLTVIGPDWGEWTASRFNAMARKRNLEGCVTAVGEKRGKALIDAVDSADAFLTTSIIEGYQLTIAEAQSRGLPVFMYELPWLTIVQQNEGIVAVPQGEAEELARQIAAVAADRDLLTALSKASTVAANRELSYDFAQLYQAAILGELPPENSPEPTMADAKQLLNLMIFFAERNAGTRDGSRIAPRHNGEDASQTNPVTSRVGRRAWALAAPAGRTLLQFFPALRPVAHRIRQKIDPLSR